MNGYKNYATQRRVLLDYLQVMIALEDWHGVSDAANDLRELDAQNKNQKAMREQHDDN